MAVVVRRAGRVIAICQRRVLLMTSADPSGESPGWMFTIGGGSEPGESTEQAARREAYEEAGMTLPADLGPVVLRRHAEFDLGGDHYTQEEDYWIVHVESPELSTGGWTQQERRDIKELRWWSLDELRSSPLQVFPENLLKLVEAALQRPPSRS